MHRLGNVLGNVLIVLGVSALIYGALWQFGLAPGSRVTLPEPIALQRTPAPTSETATAEPTLAPVAPVRPAPTQAPRPERVFVGPAPDATDRTLAAHVPKGAYAVRLAIPSIKLDTPVKQGGIVFDADGTPQWETLPFVAVHYGDLTARVGVAGNAVIAGHVVTLREGNVFRFLYQLDLDDEVQVWDDHEVEHDFRVVDVKLVDPTDVSPMAPTPDETLTLITCGGTFDPVTREFSERLIVTAKPL